MQSQLQQTFLGQTFLSPGLQSPGGLHITGGQIVKNFKNIVLGLCALIIFSGSAFAQQKSLYERLGGEKAVSLVVEDFAGNVLADARVNKKFAKSDAPRLVTNLKAFVCYATG